MGFHLSLAPSPGAAALAVALVACSIGCGGGVTPALTPDALPRLAVSGTDLVRADDGTKVVLRGFVFTAGVWYDVPAGSPQGDLASLGFMQSEADFQQIAGWGANLAILYLNHRWFDDPGGYAFVDQVLSWCRAHRVYVLPSLVVYPGGGQRGGAAFFQSPDLEEKARKFWTDFVTRYHDVPEIVGYDVLNEPQGVAIEDIVAYQTTLVDAVRAVDPKAVVFIEPEWGDPASFRQIDRPGLVYDAHFYSPLYFTSQLFPWMYAGGVPGGLHYPDSALVENVVVSSQVYDPKVPAGTYDWQTLTTQYPVPPGAELAYVKVFSNGDSGATVYFDDIEASVDGAPFAPIPNGSFEAQSEISGDADYWQSWLESTGKVERTRDAAADGQWSVRIAQSGGWVV